MRIACVHQGYELYGSDRCFAESVIAFRSAFPDAEIEVVLPCDGPIVGLLKAAATRIVFEPVWILRRRYLLKLLTLGLLKFPSAYARAIGRFRKFDLVYINTLVVTDYIVAARFFPEKALLHVHELPDGATAKIFTAMMRWAKPEIIYNSKATERTFPVVTDQPTHVIYNGIASPRAVQPSGYDGNRKLRLAMLGRINRAKGQDVLVEAVRLIEPSLRAHLEVRIVGSAFEDEEREKALHDQVIMSGLSDVISLEPFADDADPIYRWADIVAAPSKLPEALGRVAIEGLAYGRPVIASNIGGLAEIVVDGENGWLVPAGDAKALADCISHAMLDPQEWAKFGAAGQKRFEAIFSAATVAKTISGVVRDKLARAGLA